MPSKTGASTTNTASTSQGIARAALADLRRGPRCAGRQHDHRAVRQERLPRRLDDTPHPQGARGCPRLGARATLVEEPHPHRLSEHRLLRRRRLRRAGRRADLLPQGRRAAHACRRRPCWRACRRTRAATRRSSTPPKPLARRDLVLAADGKPGLHHVGPGAQGTAGPSCTSFTPCRRPNCPRRPTSSTTSSDAARGRATARRETFEGGLRVYTTLDLRMQKDALKAMKSTLPAGPAGALVSIDPANGFIRAMTTTLDCRQDAVRSRLAGPPPAGLGDEALRPGGRSRGGRQPGHHLLQLAAAAHLPGPEGGTALLERDHLLEHLRRLASTWCRPPGSQTTRSTPSSPSTWGRARSSPSPTRWASRAP